MNLRLKRREIPPHLLKYFRPVGHKPKDLINVPAFLAEALRADGWYLRAENIWHKPNPMPESVTDRPTRSHEQIFLLSKSQRYFYDNAAVREPNSPNTHGGKDPNQRKQWSLGAKFGASAKTTLGTSHEGRNPRTVWTVATKPFPDAHFATFNPELITPCILAGSKEGDTVLDPFAGSGTTGVVALRHNRNFVGVELNPSYCEMARNRIRDDAPMFNVEEAA